MTLFKSYTKEEAFILASIGMLMQGINVKPPSDSKIMFSVHHVMQEHDALTIWHFDDSIDAQRLTTGYAHDISHDVVVHICDHQMLLSPKDGKPEFYIAAAGLLHVLQGLKLISGVN